ncbi:MAG: T9SS type A sorting domain-containing protein [Saprospiraceae bacterium]
MKINYTLSIIFSICLFTSNAQSLFQNAVHLNKEAISSSGYGILSCDANVYFGDIVLAMKKHPDNAADQVLVLWSKVVNNELVSDTLDVFPANMNATNEVVFLYDFRGDPWIFYTKNTADKTGVLMAYKYDGSNWSGQQVAENVQYGPIGIGGAYQNTGVIFGQENSFHYTWLDFNIWRDEEIFSGSNLSDFAEFSSTKNHEGIYFAVSGLEDGNTSFTRVFLRNEAAQWSINREETYPAIDLNQKEKYQQGKLGIALNGEVHFWRRIDDQNEYVYRHNGTWTTLPYQVTPGLGAVQIQSGPLNDLKFSLDTTCFTLNNIGAGDYTSLIWRQPNGEVDGYSDFPQEHAHVYGMELLLKDNELFVFYKDENPNGEQIFKMTSEPVDDLVNRITSIKNLKGSNQFTVYPNPNQGQFLIKLNEIENLEKVQILDLSGRMVWNQDLKEAKDECWINLENQASGMYFLKIKSESKTYISKLIIE